MAVQPQATPEFEEKVIQVSRVSKKTKGGNKIGFSVLMVVGDKKGRVGVGLGKAQDVLAAIRKGIKKAKKQMITVPMDGTTIPFPIVVKKGAGQIMLKPAPKGSGVIAGGPVRAVVEAAGVRDISSKIMGSQNQASSVYATFAALQRIQEIVELKNISLKSVADVEAEEAKKMEEIQEKAKHTSGEKGETTREEKPAKKIAKPKTKKVAQPKGGTESVKKTATKRNTTNEVVEAAAKLEEATEEK